MKNKVLEILNSILEAKGASIIDDIDLQMRLREDLGLTSFDLAELTVKIDDEYDIDIFEDGLVSTVGEIFAKLQA